MNDVVDQYSPQKKLYNPFNNHSFFSISYIQGNLLQRVLEKCHTLIFLAGCMCPCNMVHTPKNFTDEELTKNIEEIKKKLAVNKDQLSSNIRKKISVMDDRPSARAVGSVGVVILTVCFGLLIALDYVTLTRHILGLLREIRDLFLRN